MRRKSIVSLCLGTALFSGCASIVSKSNWPIIVNSTPSEAKIKITDEKGFEVYSGITPASLKLKSGNGFFKKAIYQVRFEKEGYETKVITINSKLNGWYFGNILLGGLIGMLIVDPATGAMYKIEDENINQSLVKKSEGNLNAGQKLIIMDINDVDAEMRAALVKID